MLTIRGDTLFVATIIIVLAGFLLVQAALRVDLFRLFEARRLSRVNTTDKPNLYEFFAERHDSSFSYSPDRRRAS